MNAKSLIALAALAASATAFAAGDDIDVNRVASASSLPRAEVKAEAAQARPSGDVSLAAEQFAAAVPSTAPRAAVKAQLLQARARGEGFSGGDVVASVPTHALRRVF